MKQLYIIGIDNIIIEAVKDTKWDSFHSSVLSGGYDKIVKLTNIETGTLIQVKLIIIINY